MKALLELRKKLKSKKPSFIRHDAHKKARVSAIWRRPRGRHNKMRLSRKGYAVRRSTGYGSPVAVEGLSREGLVQNIVMNNTDFEGLDPKIDGIIIGRTVGLRKKEQLVEYATKTGFTLLNLKKENVDKAVSQKLSVKKEKQKELEKRKETRKAVAKKAEDKKKQEKEEKPLSEEEQKIAEKKEHDKILTKGDVQ
jgi:large subunit ribosomal protein L32e